jgi:cytochrome P450/NADPH-cytochrome P450 reductase
MHLSNGFNGPSITGSWLAYVLATQPDVEAKLLAEIDSITGGDPDYDLRYEDLMSLTYTTQVIKETLRIYPPMPITIRRSLRDGSLGGYRIRKGDIILVGTLAAQRDPRFWGPRPDEFDPEQFAGEKIVDRPRHAFIPFSIGKRQCMAQEVTYMMLRVVLFEICKRYRLRLAPGAAVTKNTVVTTKPAGVPILRLPRERSARTAPAAAPKPEAPVLVRGRDWGAATEIPETSPYRRITIAYGSNFGACKDLAEQFAERSRFQGFETEVLTLNDLAATPRQNEPWLLAVFTSTYTSNPPSNATSFRSLLQHGDAGDAWRNCKFLVWGLGNSQWNAFLAFPRYVHAALASLGAEPLADLAYGDVGSPLWERDHAEWNSGVWPKLIELAGARPTEAAAARAAAEKAAVGALTGADSNTAMAMSLGRSDAAPRVLLVPTILTNAAAVATVEVRATSARELQAEESPKRTRHLEVRLAAGLTYRAGDHLAVCPKNDEERVERLAERLGAALDSLFMVPKTLNVRVVPKGVVLQVRNVLTNLVDVAGKPTAPLVELLLAKATEPDERARLENIRDILQGPEGPASPLRTELDAGAYDVVELLDEFPSCRLNIFEFLQVAQPLRPRYYSPSSSPRVHGDVVHLTVGLENVPVPGRRERVFRGLSAGYVHAVREGDRMNVFLEAADGFHLQDDVSKPMIFVSAGTGLAPMRAFLWERRALKRDGVPLGEAALFNGIRSQVLDFIYRDEIESFIAEGVLDQAHVVTSRVGEPREYVQERLRAESALVWRLLEAGAYVYVCGSQAMRDGVREAILDVIAREGGMPREHAEAFLDDLENREDRYRPDLWG